MTSPSKNRTQQIIDLHKGIIFSMRRSVEDAIQIGDLLSKAKVDLNHGMFIPWIERELPFDRMTANRYMRLFEYKDKCNSVLHLQDAYRLVDRLESEAAQKERERKDFLIAEKQATGKKPAGWDCSLDREEKKRAEEAGFEARKQAVFNSRTEPAEPEPEQETKSTASQSRFEQIVDAILKESPKHVDLELSDMRENSRQGNMMKVIREYVDKFPDVSRKLETIYNLMRYLRRIAIELQPQTITQHLEGRGI